MEGSIVAVEENHQRANSTNAASNSLGSLVKIDSISIDLGIPMEKKNEAAGNKCQHFSIRGYVAEMREKDKSICMPFSLFGDDSYVEEELPPMFVTKFRSWQCGNCLRDIGAASASGETGAISKCCERGFISSTSYSHMPSNGDATAEQSNLNQALAPKNCERRESELNISANLNGHKNYFSSCSDEKGKNAEVGDMAVNGIQCHDNGVEDNANREVGNRTCQIQLLQQCLINERHMDRAVPVQSKSSRSVEISEPNPGLHDAAGVLPAIEYPKSKAESSAGIFVKINSSDGEQRNGLINCEMSEEGRKIGEETNVDKGKKIRLPSVEVEEFVKPSSESDEIIANSDYSQHPESSSLQRREQKTRLLAELLESRENPENDNRKTSGGCSNAVPNVSNGVASVSANQDELSLSGITGNGSSGAQKKRKIEEGTKTMDSSCSKFFVKKARTLKANEDLTKRAIEISGSEMEDNVPVGTKSKLKKRGIDRNSILGQKKNKHAHVGDGCLQLGSWKDVVIPKVHNKIKDAEKSGATVADPFRSRGTESYFKSYMSVQPTGKESSSSSKRKNKMPQVEDGQAFPMPPSRSVFEEGSIKRNDIRILQDGSETVKSRPGNDVCTKMGLDLSLNSCTSAERNEQSHIAQVADKSGFLLPRPKAIPSKDPKRKDRMFVGEPSVSRKSAPDPFMRERLHYDLNDRIAYRTAILHDTQNCSPRLEDGSFSMRPNLDLSGPSNSKRSAEGHSLLETIRRHNDRHNDQRAGKVFEQGTSDEVPMEIVELMAKNQYERGLCEAEKNYNLSGRVNNNKSSNAEMIGFSKVHGNGVMRILPKEYPSMRKPPPTNSKNGILQTGENVGPAKQNHFNFFPSDHRNRFNIGPQEENPGFKMFDSFSPSIQFQNGFQNDKAEQLWSFRPNLPEDGPTQATDWDIRAQIPEKNKEKIIRDLDLNKEALNTSNLENPNTTPDSEPYTGISMAYHQPGREQIGNDRNPKVMGSFDSLSNEAIPAMQLLSLMHAGLKTTKPLDVDPKRVFQKPFYPCGNHPNFNMEKPLLPCNYNSKAFSGLGSGVVYKAGESSRNPSNYSKNQTLDNFCECASPVAADPFVSMLRSDRNQKRPVGSENRIFFKPREQEKERRSYPTPQNKGRKSQKSGAPHTVLEFNPVLDKQKGVIGPSKPGLFKDFTKSSDLDGSFKRGTVRPLRITSRTEICTLNKNPADFSIPERGNVYTISGEDLRFPKRIPMSVKSKILRQ
ncbi:hypothetical protein LguiA_033338 [Lonicera macranthoides]